MKLQPCIPFHIFSITTRCERTGRLGIAITTRAITAGSRCPFVKANVGAVATQANTDPRLGPMALRLIETVHSTSEALKELEASDRTSSTGNWRLWTGTATPQHAQAEWAGHIAELNYIAMGNVLLGRHVIKARRWRNDFYSP